jgi:hypothetical protein
MHLKYFYQIHPLYFSMLSPTFSVFSVFCFAIFIHALDVLWLYSLLPSPSCSFPQISLVYIHIVSRVHIGGNLLVSLLNWAYLTQEFHLFFAINIISFFILDIYFLYLLISCFPVKVTADDLKCVQWNWRMYILM